MDASSFNGWQILAGIGLFLFGMSLMENAIRHLAGRSFKVFLRKQTSNPFKAVLAGLLITALLQSSSIVNLLTLAFVAARIVTMPNALAVILGANVGSTVYNWIVVYAGFRYEIESFSYPLMALGGLGLVFFQSNKRIMHWTRLTIGFSMLFLGLSNIKEGVEMFVSDINFTLYTQYGNWLFAIAGFLITAIVQSSSTTVVITLAALHAGALDLSAAAALVVGSELGTSIKVVLGAVGNIPDKKKVALGNFIINLTGSVAAFIFLSPLLSFISGVVGIADPLLALVFFQSTINVLTLFIFFPFLSPFARFLEKKYGSEGVSLSVYLKKLLLNDPEEGVVAIEKETRRLLLNTVVLNMEALEMDRTGNDHIIKSADLVTRPRGQSYSDHYETIKHLNGEILDFCIELKESDQDGSETINLDALLSILRQAMNTAKSIKDIRHNIKNYRDSENDLLHDFFIRIRENEAPFYNSLAEALYAGDSHEAGQTLQRLSSENKLRYDLYLAEVFKLSGKEQLEDLELATLMNVFTAIHASHESLTQAVNELNIMRPSAKR